MVRDLTKEEAIDEDIDSDIWNNPLVFFLLGAFALLCLVAIFLSIAFSYRLRKRNFEAYG